MPELLKTMCELWGPTLLVHLVRVFSHGGAFGYKELDFSFADHIYHKPKPLTKPVAPTNNHNLCGTGVFCRYVTLSQPAK